LAFAPSYADAFHLVVAIRNLCQGLLQCGIEQGLKRRIQSHQNFVRRRSCGRFLGSISGHAREADQVWPVCPVNGIHRVIDRCVQDRKAPRRMRRGWLRSRSTDDYEECPIPLNNGVHLLNRGVVCTLMLVIRRSIRTKGQNRKTGTQQSEHNQDS
jgi:hypothetical protein